MPEPAKSVSPRYPQKKRSFSKTLTAALILTVVSVSVVTVSMSYFTVAKKAKLQLEGRADEYLASLASVLAMPLWELDESAARSIGNAYFQNELIEKIKITDNMGDIFFDSDRKSKAPLVSRAGNIVHHGQLVGYLEISLTEKYNAAVHRQLLLSGMGTLFAVILVLVIATRFLLRMLLTRPLDHLGRIVNDYAAGRYDLPGRDMPFIEFQPLVNVLGEMGGKINSQMTELRDAEKKYRSIFENAVEGIFQSTPEGRFLSANPSMARMLGYDSPAELIESITDIGNQLYVDPERRLEFLQMMREGKTVAGLQVQFYRKDKSTVWSSIHARPLLGEKGELVLTEGIAEDITEYRRAEAERAKLENQLHQSQKMETVGLLAGGIAHDFNNLLTIILGYSDMLAADFAEDDPRRDKVKAITHAGERAKEMTQRLLAFSRKQIIEPKPLALGAIIQQFVDMLRRTIREDIVIELRISPSLSLVRADPGQIEQVLANLSINAQDAMPEGGILTIEANDIDLDESYTTSHPEIVPGPYAMLAVSDTGMGMDNESMEHIFDPFFTTKELGKGTGLGLSILYAAVTGSSGSVGVKSREGTGTEFRIL
ncbi:MAG: PAS domain-containing protein, partial [Proteobacteria bacterium]|nr:PAS domain-containing protein [Pseudomonadota bacterium]